MITGRIAERPRNATLFAEDEEIVVFGDSPDELPEILARGLSQQGVPLIGCIGYSDFLANPSLELIVTHLDGELLAGRAAPNRTIGQVAIGAMQAGHAMDGGWKNFVDGMNYVRKDSEVGLLTLVKALGQVGMPAASFRALDTRTAS